jgi:hypothetical protein
MRRGGGSEATVRRFSRQRLRFFGHLLLGGGDGGEGKEAIMRRAGMVLRRVAAQGASRIRAGFLAGEPGVPTALSPEPCASSASGELAPSPEPPRRGNRRASGPLPHRPN